MYTLKPVAWFLTRAAKRLTALVAVLPLVAASAEPPQAGTQVAHLRPSLEQRRGFEERMLAIHPAKPGCFEAHYPEELWIEKQCLPAPRTPNPHAQPHHTDNVGAGKGWFATVSSGNISQATGSFDSVSGVIDIYGFTAGETSTLFPNTYVLQMNSNTFTTTEGSCNTITHCAGWEQFLMSQTQCGAKPCAFIEYWLLNAKNPCPADAPWKFNDQPPGTTPGCFFNTGATDLSAVSISDLGSIRMNAVIRGGMDIVTISDASGMVGSNSNASVLNLGTGWQSIEYNLFGDCCGTESFFTNSTTTSLTVRAAVVNGTTTAPTCSSSFSGTTAETNNLDLSSSCTPAGGTAPAIVFTESGGGPIPPGLPISTGVAVNNTLGFIKTANTPNGHVEVHLAAGNSGYMNRYLETPTTFGNESDGVWQLMPNGDLVFIKTSHTPNGHVEVHIASAASNYQSRVVERATTFGNESDGTWQLLPNKDLAFIKTSNTPSGHIEVHIASATSNYQTRVVETATTFGNETDGVWQLLPNRDLAFIKTSNTPNGHVEVHIASATSNYQARIIETATTFGSEIDGIWQLISNSDLAFIKTSNTPSGRVEVHIASAASNYQTRIVEVPTTFSDETDGTWNLIVVPRHK